MRSLVLRLYGVAGAVLIATSLTFASPMAERVWARAACATDGAAAYVSLQ